MRYHGNYCGPNWSAGSVQESVVSEVPAVDEFDATCKTHDASYALRENLFNADLEFIASNLGHGPKRDVAAIAVGANMIMRETRSKIRTIFNNQMTKPNQPSKSALRSERQNNNPRATAAASSVPAAVGFTLRMTPPKVVRTGNKASIVGADFASSVIVTNTSSYAPAASVLLNPAYFNNTMLGSLARAYEKFRFAKATIHYIPAVPTSTQGQLVMCSTRTVKEPFLDGSATSFLSRALSQGNAVACPLWKETYLEVDCGAEWSVVDALIDADIDDCIQEEVQCYATCDSSITAGILMVHYTVEFKDPLYTYHPTMIPVPQGNGFFCTLQDNSAVNAVTDAIVLASASPAVTGGNGSVYRLIFRPTASVLPTGPANWAAYASVQTIIGATTTTSAAVSSTITMTSGTTLYGKLGSGGLALYTSYEHAVAGSVSGLLIYQTATTAAGTLSFIAALVRLSDVNQITVQ